MPQIEVTFDIDANGIVNVSAKDKATNKEQSIRIQASGGLSEADIDQMVKDAEAHAAEDKKKREEVETRNHAEALVHSTEKTLAENGDKVSAEVKGEIEAGIEALKTALKDGSIDDVNAKMQALTQSAMKLGEAIYKASQDAGAAEGGEGPAGGDDVVDADFEEVDETKRDGQGNA